MSAPYRRRELRMFVCPECAAEFEVRGEVCAGTFFADEDPPTCPQCGHGFGPALVAPQERREVAARHVAHEALKRDAEIELAAIVERPYDSGPKPPLSMLEAATLFIVHLRLQHRHGEKWGQRAILNTVLWVAGRTQCELDRQLCVLLNVLNLHLGGEIR